MGNPFVSCVCVTGKTPWHVKNVLPAAVQSWRDQTYDNKELLLVSDRKVVNAFNDAHIRVCRSDATTLGGLRNHGLREAKGDIVVQWDDDCYSSPKRLEVQVKEYLENPGIPVLFKREMLYSSTTDTACIRTCEGTCMHGSIMHPRVPLPSIRSYPETGQAEDTDFLKAWGQWFEMNNDPALLLSLEHGHNTWPAAHHLREFAAPWGLGEWTLGDRHRDYLRNILRQYPFIRSDVGCNSACLE